MIDGLRYCTKCIMPETVEGQEFDGRGWCRTCVSQEQKLEVDWLERERALLKILNDATRNAKGNYDCIVPISGGKDSLWQLHVLVKRYGMKPLAVTYDHGGFCKTGLRNLSIAIESMGIPHLKLKDPDDLIKRMQKRSIELIGDPCWHCHSGVPAIALNTAMEKGIPLIVWGESTAEHGRATYAKPDKFDRNYFLRVSGKYTPEQFACDYIGLEELKNFRLPTEKQCRKLHGIHLGDYIPWNVEEQVAFIKKEYGWAGREISGSYKDYKSAECSFEGYHEFTCYLKRGYGRSSVQASEDIRAGRMTREQAIGIVPKYEAVKPVWFDEFLEDINLSRMRFQNAIINLRHPALLKVQRDKADFCDEWRTCAEDGKPFMRRLVDGEEE